MAKPSSTAPNAARAVQKDAAVAPSASIPSRTTRSMSREPSVQPPNTRTRAQGRAAVDDKPSEDLPTVTEDEADQEEADEADESEVNEGLDDEAEDALNRRPSNASGVTTKTSFSQEEIEDLDPELMLTLMPDLANAAKSLLTILVPSDPSVPSTRWAQFHTANSSLAKVFAKRAATFDDNRKDFSSQPYIRPDLVMRALINVASIDDVPQGAPIPDAVIQLANLAQMVRQIMLVSIDAPEVYEARFQVLQTLLTYMPRAIGPSEFDYETVQFCVAIQTQIAIARLLLQTNESADPAYEVFDDVFYVEDDEVGSRYALSDALYIDALESHEAQAKVLTLIDKTVGELQNTFDGVDNATYVDKVTRVAEMAPWEDFTQQVVAHQARRQAQIESDIQAEGGVEQLTATLRAAIEQLDKLEVLPKVMPQQPRTTAPDKKAIGSLKKRMQANKSTASSVKAPVARMTATTRASASTAAPAPIDDEWAQAMDDGVQLNDHQSTATLSLRHLSGFQEHQSKLVAASKGKARLIDSQPDAQRMEFEVDDSPEPARGARARPSVRQPASSGQPGSSGPKKRTHANIADEGEDFDPTQDEGFERDTRDASAADARRKSAPVRRAPKQARTTQVVQYEQPASIEPALEPESESSRARKNPGTALPPHPSPLDPNHESSSSMYQQAKARARYNTVISSRSRPAQVRTPWAAAEEDRLMQLIEEHGEGGISWSLLKSIDEDAGPEPALSRRNKEHLREKARNMKMTMLKANIQLPRNWEHVALPRGMIDILNQLGVNYDQVRIRNRTFD